jgi:type IV secretory pathway TrbL component
MTAVASILGAAVLAFIAYKVLMGLVRVGVIILILAVLAGMWSQGLIG